MIQKDLPKYIQNNWEERKVSVTLASMPDNHKDPLVESEKEVYHFDQICSDVLKIKNNQSSADAVQIRGNDVDLIEFKSGFKQNITKKTFQKEKCLCERLSPHAYCNDYGKLFLKCQEKIRNELLDSLKLKAIESYVLLEKHFLPLCETIEDGHQIRINYVVVVDVDDADDMENGLAELADTQLDAESDNDLVSIKKSLLRFQKRQDAEDHPYLFDSIRVLSAVDFKNQIEHSS